MALIAAGKLRGLKSVLELQIDEMKEKAGL